MPGGVLLVSGDRYYKDIEAVWEALKGLRHYYETLVHGDADGADFMCKVIATGFGMVVKAYPADWERFGKPAGPIRNSEMIEKEKPDALVFFHYNLHSSRGTIDCIKKCQAKGIPVVEAHRWHTLVPGRVK